MIRYDKKSLACVKTARAVTNGYTGVNMSSCPPDFCHQRVVPELDADPVGLRRKDGQVRPKASLLLFDWLESPTVLSKGLVTGPFNGPVLFCWLASVVICRLSSSFVVVVVCNDAGWRGRRESGNAVWERARRPAGRPLGAWTVGRPTLHGGPVASRPVRATPCL